MSTPVASSPRAAASPLKGAAPVIRPESAEGRLNGFCARNTAFEGQ